MKRNVDLTQNEMFITHNPHFTDIMRNILYRLPWDFINAREITDQDLFGKDELILTGTKKDRLEKRFTIGESIGYYCDCCGINLRKRPWLRSDCYDLCQKCSHELNFERHGKIPWRPHIQVQKEKIPWNLPQQGVNRKDGV